MDHNSAGHSLLRSHLTPALQRVTLPVTLLLSTPTFTGAMNKKLLSERDNCTKFVVPALQSAGWNIQHQVRKEGIQFIKAPQVSSKFSRLTSLAHRFKSSVSSVAPTNTRLQ